MGWMQREVRAVADKDRKRLRKEFEDRVKTLVMATAKVIHRVRFHPLLMMQC